MYSRKALQELRDREQLKPAPVAAAGAPATLAELPADVPMDDDLDCGFYDDELGRFIAPELWMQRQRMRAAE